MIMTKDDLVLELCELLAKISILSKFSFHDADTVDNGGVVSSKYRSEGSLGFHVTHVIYQVDSNMTGKRDCFLPLSAQSCPHD